jgi:hypothetical protein
MIISISRPAGPADLSVVPYHTAYGMYEVDPARHYGTKSIVQYGYCPHSLYTVCIIIFQRRGLPFRSERSSVLWVSFSINSIIWPPCPA